MAKRPVVSRTAQLASENDELRARLNEAEETLRAIQSGEVDAVVVSGPDGSERIFTLKGAEYAYRALVEAMNEGAATIAGDGTVLYCNRKFTDLLELPHERVIGANVILLVCEPDKQTFSALFSGAIAGEAGKAEIQLRARNSTFAPVYVSLSPLQVNDSPAVCLVVTDLAEHKKREALIAAGSLARSILEHAAEAIAVCGQDGQIVMANEALRQLCGSNPLWEPLDRVLPLEVVTGSVAGGQQTRRFSVSEALQGNRFRAEEVIYRTSNGQGGEDGMRWLLLTSGPTMSGSQVVGCVLTLLDITNRKMAEKALLRNEKLAATGQLAATIAHEINNPLAAVHNLLYLIENETNPAQARAYSALAAQELTRVSHITKQTLAFYRDLTNPEAIRLSQLIDEVLALYAREITGRRAVVEKRYQIPGDVYGFPGEMRQVFSNLIRNAIQAVAEGGHLLLQIRPSRRKGRAGVAVFIVDNGHGIRPELHSRIFEPFFTTKGQKGTGLGLWVARDLVLKHDGIIQVRSRVVAGRSGSCFYVFLPSPSPPVSS